jgi:WD40 repeat protein
VKCILTFAALLLVLVAVSPAQQGQSEAITLSTTSPVRFFNLARSGSVATTVCRDNHLRVWALPQGQLLRTIDLGERPFEVTALSDDGRLLLVADHNGAVAVWDTSNGEAWWQTQLAHYPGVVAFSRDGRLLALAAQGDPVQIFNLTDKRKLYELEQTAGGTMAIAFSRDGALLASADADTKVRVYDAHSGKLISHNDDFLLEPLAVDFSADSKQVVAAGADKVTVFIDAASGRLARRLEKAAEPVAYLEVSPGGDALATVFMKAANMTEPAPVAVWDVRTGRQRTNWLPPTPPIAGGWTRDGHLQAVTATPEAVHIWRVQ